MTKLLFAAALLAAVRAGAVEPATVTIEGVSSTDTIRGLSISSEPATSVIISTNMGYRQVCVQNIDGGSYLACGDSINVSTLAASNAVGVWISTFVATQANPPVCFGVPAFKDWFCRTSNVAGSTRAVIQRKR